jgi:hypothetical protein
MSSVGVWLRVPQRSPRASAQLMEPPSALAEVINWPAWLLRDLVGLDGGLLAAGVLQKLRSGLDIRSAFTGIDCFRMSCEMTCHELGLQPATVFHCAESCDLDPVCRDILSKWPNSEDHALCSDILDRLSTNTRPGVL